MRIVKQREQPNNSNQSVNLFIERNATEKSKDLFYLMVNR